MYYAKSEQGEFKIKFFHDHTPEGVSAGGHPWKGTTRVEIAAPGGEPFRSATVKRGLCDNFSRALGRRFAILRATEGLDRGLRHLLCAAVLGKRKVRKLQALTAAAPPAEVTEVAV